jgi:hypothetical protein
MCGRAASHICERTPNAGFETSRVDRVVSGRRRKAGLKTTDATSARIVLHAAREQLEESSLCSDERYMAGRRGVFKAKSWEPDVPALIDLNRGFMRPR